VVYIQQQGDVAIPGVACPSKWLLVTEALLTVDETRQFLTSLDWDFLDASTKHDIHTIHPYPARFIPQIPRQLLETLMPYSRAVVLDPFCGSGTTLVEAIALGHNAVGVDLNPLACLIAEVKTTPVAAGLADAAHHVTLSAQAAYDAGQLTIPSIPAIDHWFKVDVQRALAALVESIQQEQSYTFRQAMRVALSSIIVRVSNQESNTRYAAITKTVSGDDVFTYFRAAAVRISRALHTYRGDLFAQWGTAAVLNKDILDLTADDLPSPIDIVITSPPYPNAYEYWLYHKYRMYWLGMDPIEVRTREIGARPHYFRKNPQTADDFERQIGSCFHLLAQVLRPTAPACFLVGHSIIHGQEIDNVALLKRAAEPHGFLVDQVITRTIPKQRKAFNPKHGRIEQEYIMVFRLGT